MHFYAVAAKAMRSVLVDHARRRNASKRGGGRDGGTLPPLPLDEALAVFDDHQLDILALDHAMAGLSQQDERKCKVVEMRFFAGMTNAEIAQALGVSEPTVERDWRMARAWLARELGEGALEGAALPQ
jgi:RNA polymerase sigma factor (TIGR02999 family)